SHPASNGRTMDRSKRIALGHRASGCVSEGGCRAAACRPARVWRSRYDDERAGCTFRALATATIHCRQVAVDQPSRNRMGRSMTSQSRPTRSPDSFLYTHVGGVGDESEFESTEFQAGSVIHGRSVLLERCHLNRTRIEQSVGSQFMRCSMETV